MIIAEAKPLNDGMYLFRFSDAHEHFTGEQDWLVASSRFDLERRLNFKNRQYIADVLASWLRQRIHALASRPTDVSRANALLTCIEQYRQTSLIQFCNRMIGYIPAF